MTLNDLDTLRANRYINDCILDFAIDNIYKKIEGNDYYIPSSLFFNRLMTLGNFFINNF